MTTIAVNWITLREHFELEIDKLLSDREKALLPDIARKTASKLVVEVRRGRQTNDQVREIGDQLLMNAKIHNMDMEDEQVHELFYGLWRGAIAGIAAVKSR